MSKRTCLIIAFLILVAAFTCSGMVFDAVMNIVVPDNVSVHTINPAGGILMAFRFSLPFALACVAIPMAFMIIQNHFRAVVVVILSLAGAGIALFVIRHQLRAGLAFGAHLGIRPMLTTRALHLEVIPWVSFGVLLIGLI